MGLTIDPLSFDEQDMATSPPEGETVTNNENNENNAKDRSSNDASVLIPTRIDTYPERHFGHMRARKIFARIQGFRKNPRFFQKFEIFAKI